MKRVVLFVLVATNLLSDEMNTLHIKAALSAYEAAKNAAREKQYDIAIARFREAIEIEPTFRSAFDGLIDACLNAGRRQQAAVAMTQVLEIEPHAIPYRLQLGQILLEQNQADRALAQFSLALKDEPLNPDALWLFARAAKRAGMNDRSAEALEQGRKKFPRDERFTRRLEP